MARHFQYKVEVHFKEIILDGYNFKKGFHSFKWDFNAPDIENEVVCIEFIEKFPDHLNDREPFDLVKTCQVYSHS